MKILDLKQVFENSRKTCVLYEYVCDEFGNREFQHLFTGQIKDIPDKYDKEGFDVYDLTQSMKEHFKLEHDVDFEINI